MNCKDFIKDIINKKGPISFYDYLRVALYNPVYGYYNKVNNFPGEEGDFYTSCSHPIFGELLAKQIVQIAQLMEVETFSIIEYGGGNGCLCREILTYFERYSPDTYNKLNYFIIEKGCQNSAFTHSKLTWLESDADLYNLTACILSNELVDNFPVHLVKMQDRLMEIFVDAKQDNLIEVLIPARKQLCDYFQELCIQLPFGSVVEINLDAITWISEVSRVLKKGFTITIDYGFNSEELYADKRRNGTILCYNKHHIHDDPYRNPGDEDITAHVNFSALIHWGEKAGLHFSGYTSQSYFMRALGFTRMLEKSCLTKEDMKGKKLLTDFTGRFASAMNVLIQQKNVDCFNLQGLLFGIRKVGHIHAR